MIKLQNLHKFFNKGRQNEIHVINDVSLELPERGMVAIFGKSGCGKTTLLNVIGGLDGCNSGTLTLDGQPMSVDADELRNRCIGYVFQNYNLNKAESCFDNVADALRLCGVDDPEELEKRTMAALANVGMEKYRLRTPDTLSGGQQQRIAIARAIVKNPHVILADEPTGNLDETNTLHVMNLLREIAKERLVLLVTHEADLVDYYCDTVIELQDGRVVNVKRNADAFGYSARSKHEIFLGELPHVSEQSANTQVEYFGDAPNAPIQLRIVNHNGNMYVQIQSPNVQILDETSEIRLREGVFEREKQDALQTEQIDMSALPPVEGDRYGKLFSFRSSVQSGFQANFRHKKKGKKLLLGCMACFSAVLVLMTAIFGTAIDALMEADKAYNHNVFYVYTPTAEVSQKLNTAVNDAHTGINYARLYAEGRPRGDQNISFLAGYFETFAAQGYASSFYANAVCLDTTLAEGLPLLAGRNTELADTDVLITSAVADKLLEASAFSYIHDYESLIGLISNRLSVNRQTVRIAGVVQSEETAVYLTEYGLAQYVLTNNHSLSVYPVSVYPLSLDEGNVIYVTDGQEPNKVNAPKVGEKISIHGLTFTVSEIKRISNDRPFGEEYGQVPYYFTRGYLMHDADVNRISKQVGDTHPTAMNDYGYVDDFYYEEVIVDTAFGVTEEIMLSEKSGGSLYTVLHSVDPARTAAWLAETFPDLTTGNTYHPAILTPDYIYDDLIKDQRQEIMAQLIVMAVLLTVMSVCMYFIMRSSLMNRIKEIGICRAIGVSRRNLIFRFFVEALVLSGLTVFIGFLLVSGALAAWLAVSPLMSDLFFYPIWMALGLLVLLFAICIFCGTVPIMLLLRKSPSEILAKYDI